MTKYWYAIQRNEEDNDWGTGSYDLEEAKKMAKAAGCKKIAVIDESGDGLCVDEIDLEEN